MIDKGAHFYRCDLQVHSPRDRNWSGSDCITIDERRAYAAELVQACRDKGIHGIAITDHHDMECAAHIRRVAAEETDREGNPLAKADQLVVFPGMELTLGVPCQALVIFDADFPDDLFGLAMSALAINPSLSTDAKTAQTERLNHIQSLTQLKAELDKHTYLRERYTVFPNVTNEGKFSLLRTGLAGKYAEMPWVGAYVDGDITRLKQGTQTILAGKDKNYGYKRVACFQTSDNRHRDHRLLGTYSSWIKWAKPTAEALRQACLASESRVTHLQPRLPVIVINSVTVSNSAFLGPFDLALNPQYNALIGGRGSGKSTILEYLRWALCDQPPDRMDEDAPNYQARRTRLIDQTLKPLNATVEIRFDLNGVPHIVRRKSEDGSLFLKIASGDLRPCSDDEVRSLLPVQAYSQKQLSDVSVRSGELLRFITAPIRGDLARIDGQLSELSVRVRQTYTALVQHRALAQTLKRQELEERSLVEQVNTLRASLTGLSQEDRNLLDRRKDYATADAMIRSWRDGIDFVRESATQVQREIATRMARIGQPVVETEIDILTAAHASYLKYLNDASENLSSIITDADARLAVHADNPWQKWQGKLTDFQTAYEAAVHRSTAHADKLTQLKAIEESLARCSQDIVRVKETLSTQPAIETNYRSAYTAWKDALDQKINLLEAQCQNLTDSSGGAILARLKKCANAEKFIGALKQSLTGQRVSGAKIDGIGEAITSADDQCGSWAAILTDLEQLALYEGVDRKPSTPALSAAGLTANDLDRMSHGLKIENWLDLSLITIESQPTFEYRAREGEYILFENASAGQQATALLKTLLNQTGPPLIIDQPEEDLDNPVMLEVVAQVWEAKRKRQIIFASHNANLVVNGDAELVAWCDYRATGDQSRGKIAGEGAIDIPEVRDAIKQIMEGGEAAFKLRREKYGF